MAHLNLIDRLKKYGPTRVIVSKSGEAVSASRALSEFFIVPDVIFVRRDGWSLGAPQQFAEAAWGLWPDEWAHEIRMDYAGINRLRK